MYRRPVAARRTVRPTGGPGRELVARSGTYTSRARPMDRRATETAHCSPSSSARLPCGDWCSVFRFPVGRRVLLPTCTPATGTRSGCGVCDAHGCLISSLRGPHGPSLPTGGSGCIVYALAGTKWPRGQREAANVALNDARCGDGAAGAATAAVGGGYSSYIALSNTAIHLGMERRFGVHGSSDDCPCHRPLEYGNPSQVWNVDSEYMGPLMIASAISSPKLFG